MEILFTNEKSYCDLWDAFVLEHPKGCHLMLTDWLISYRSYGFDFEIALLIENGKIHGGYAAVVAKVLFFKFYVVPYGPIAEGNSLIQLAKAIEKRATTHNCCLYQFNYPFASTNFNSTHFYDLKPDFEALKKGSVFKYIYATNGLNWVDFKPYPTPDELLLSFRSSVRRDIRSSQRKGLERRFLTSNESVRDAYALCEQNAKSKGYALRDWKSFGPVVMQLIQKGSAHFIACYKDNDLKGAVFLVKSGQYYTYILGGTKRETPDLLPGHFLQWEAITMSYNEGADGYNISMGGSKGVVEFKAGFNPNPIGFEEGKHFKILKPLTVKCFLFFDKKIKPHKALISKVLTKIRRK